MKRYILVLRMICICLVLAAVSAAQNQANPTTSPSSEVSVAHLIRFSGTVKDDAGNPKSGVVGITFALYKDQEGGAALWLETQNVHLDSKGNYTVLLGSAKAEGLPTDIFTTTHSLVSMATEPDRDGGHSRGSYRRSKRQHSHRVVLI